MRSRGILVLIAAAAVSSTAVAATKWEALGEGRLEIKNPDLQAPKDNVPSVCPLKHTDVKIVVRGSVAEATVTQQFQNALDRPIEAEYVFPLPHNAAVNATEMRIGARVVHGRIDRREAARKAYEDARDQGKRTSLLEQERPNIFTQSVANIAPGETIDVTIRYVQVLTYADGRYEVVFPMVVGPRYIPGVPTLSGAKGNGRLPNTDEVPDASRITPVVYAPDERCGHDISVTVDIDAGLAIRGLRSRSHRVAVKRDGESKAVVSLAEDDRIPNKDFVLNLEVAGAQPEVGLVAHHDGKQGHFLLILQPPRKAEAAQLVPREIICVLDCSGSMDGDPIRLSKRAAERLIAGLRPTDRFNVLSFSDQARSFRPAPVPASAENIREGTAYVRSLAAGGGTEMLTGVRAALATPPPEGFVRLVPFFTDGYIGNEGAVIAEVRRLLGPARLFSFGVGSSVNRFLLDRLAHVGRGTVQYVLLNDQPEEAVDAFALRVAKPVLTNVDLNFAGLTVRDLTPSPLPDVFMGTPIYLYGRYDKAGEAEIEVRGRLGTEASVAKVRVVLPGPGLPAPPRQAGDGRSPLPSMWAKQRIEQLELDKLAARDLAAVEKQVTDLALEYSLMSAYTSFVAVDETPVAGGGKPQYVPVSAPMPEGVNYETTVGPYAGGPGGPYASGGGPSNRDGGGPIGPLGLAFVAAVAGIEWRRRRKARASNQP